jgi:hypothetical protein
MSSFACFASNVFEADVLKSTGKDVSVAADQPVPLQVKKCIAEVWNVVKALLTIGIKLKEE